MQSILKEMLQSIINGKEEEASVLLHEYFVAKTKEVTGLSEAELSEEEVDAILEDATEEELEEAVRGVWANRASKHVGIPTANKRERDAMARALKANRAANRAAYDGDAIERREDDTDETYAKRQAKFSKNKDSYLTGKGSANTTLANDERGKVNHFFARAYDDKKDFQRDTSDLGKRLGYGTRIKPFSEKP